MRVPALTGRGRLRLAPYQWYSALHTGSGTISKSLPGTSCRERFTLPPSMVSVGAWRDKRKKKVLHNSHTTICTRDHPSAWITRNRQKAHPDSMRSLLSLEQIAEIKTKRQETPSAPREPWLSHENLFFPLPSRNHKSVLVSNQRGSRQKEDFFFGGFLLWMRWREMSRGKFAFAVYQKAGNTSGFLPHGFVRRAGRFLRRAELQWSRSRENSPAPRLGATVRCSGEARKKTVNATCDPCCIIVSWWGRMGLRLCKH